MKHPVLGPCEIHIDKETQIKFLVPLTEVGFEITKKIVLTYNPTPLHITDKQGRYCPISTTYIPILINTSKSLEQLNINVGEKLRELSKRIESAEISLAFHH